MARTAFRCPRHGLCIVSSPNGFIDPPKETIMNTIIFTPLRTLVAGAILSALAFSFATVSSADERTTPPQVAVKFGDLDVSTAQGAKALYRRIQGAAIDVCSSMYVIEAAYKVHKGACLQKVIADAVTHVNQPALSAVFASKYRTSQPVVLAAQGH
jgi:UrcA family protein